VYCKRLTFGVKPEIVPLTEIPGVKQARARALWNGGFRTVKQVALASAKDIARSTNLGSFGNNERTAQRIIRAAKELLERKAKELRETAEEMLSSSINVDRIVLAGVAAQVQLPTRASALTQRNDSNVSAWEKLAEGFVQ